jgi:hypothetical protein
VRHVLLLQTCLSSSQTKRKDDVITSLEEWAAGLLKPDITDILKVAKKDSDTKKRFEHAKKPTNFQLTDMNYTTKGNKVCDKNLPTSARPTETVTKLPMNCA